MDRADRVAQGSLGVAAVFLDCLDGRLDVARVVEGVEHAENVDAVFDRERHEPVDDIVGVVAVAHEVLAAQQHLQRGLLGQRLDLAQAFPGVLAQEAQADVEGGTAPALEGVVADAVDGLDDPEDVVGAHACRPERLVRVAQRGVGDAHGGL